MPVIMNGHQPGYDKLRMQLPTSPTPSSPRGRFSSSGGYDYAHPPTPGTPGAYGHGKRGSQTSTGYDYANPPPRRSTNCSIGHDYATLSNVRRKASNTSTTSGHDYASRASLGFNQPANSSGFYSAVAPSPPTTRKNAPNMTAALQTKKEAYSSIQRGQQNKVHQPQFYSVLSKSSPTNAPPTRNTSLPDVSKAPRWEWLAFNESAPLNRRLSIDYDYKNEPWYHDTNDRAECEQMLQQARDACGPDGLFLVRATRHPNMLCASVIYHGLDKVYHNRIEVMGKNLFKYLGSGDCFQTVENLLTHHHALHPRIENSPSANKLGAANDGSIRLRAYVSGRSY